MERFQLRMEQNDEPFTPSAGSRAEDWSVDDYGRRTDIGRQVVGRLSAGAASEGFGRACLESETSRGSITRIAYPAFDGMQVDPSSVTSSPREPRPGNQGGN